MLMPTNDGHNPPVRHVHSYWMVYSTIANYCFDGLVNQKNGDARMEWDRFWRWKSWFWQVSVMGSHKSRKKDTKYKLFHPKFCAILLVNIWYQWYPGKYSKNGTEKARYAKILKWGKNTPFLVNYLTFWKFDLEWNPRV